MIEYEYSFIVENPNIYIDYCKKNNYIPKSSSQIRKLYTSNNRILARITTDTINNKSTTVLDFKDEDDSKKVLKSSRETIPLKITKTNQESIYSILNILGYTLSKTLIRSRTTYTKDNVKFEIDEYLEPEKCFVVAIEGEKTKVDEIYNSFTNNQ